MTQRELLDNKAQLSIFYFYSNYDPIWNYLVEEKSLHDPCFHGLAYILIIYTNGLLISIIQYLSLSVAKNVPGLHLLLFCIVLVRRTDYRQCRINYQNKPLPTGLPVFKKLDRHCLCSSVYNGYFLTPLVSVDLINREKESSQIKILCFYTPPPHPGLNDQGHIVFVLHVC